MRRPRLLSAIVLPPLLLVGIYFAACFAVLHPSLTPQRKVPDTTPAQQGFAAEAVHFQSEIDAVPLSGWLLRSAGERAIVLVHGVGSHGWDDCQPELARSYVAAGFNVLVLDLRAHGASGGERLGLGWDEKGDVLAAVKFLVQRGFARGRIGLHGSSYGAATVLLAAPLLPGIGAIVADSAFADIRDIMAAEIEKRIGVPRAITQALLRPGIALLARTMYSLDLDTIAPERAVSALALTPVLFTHGAEDHVIPVQHARRLMARSRSNLHTLWILAGRRHTEGVCLEGGRKARSPVREVYLARVTAFFNLRVR